MGLGAATQPHVAVDAGVIEEVVPVLLLRALGRVDDNPRRNGLEGQPIIDTNREPTFFARADMIGDIGFEREVPANMSDDLDVVDPDGGGMSRRLEMDDDAIIGPTARNANLTLVPDWANVIAGGGISGEILVRRRNCHLGARGQRSSEPFLCLAAVLGVEGKVPHPRQTLRVPGGGVLWSQHHDLLPVVAFGF